MLVDLADTGVKVHLVNPAVIDTELFSLPDNDPMVAQVEAMPVSEIVAPVLEQIESGEFEICVPDSYAGIIAGKFADITRYFDGTLEWLRSQQAAR